MATILTKPIEELTATDVRELIDTGMPEGDQIEYKERLPSNKRSDDWYNGATSIGEKARNEILEEVVAFANAYGGCLIVGIRESDEQPRRAVGINPVPRCAELAERLRLQARDCIAPRLAVVNIVGIETDGDGSGVVVIRLPPSPLRPHRLEPTKECYVRRHERSEKMSMREIQDLTLSATRLGDTVNARFAYLGSLFTERFNTVKSGGAQVLIGVRASAVPVGGEISVDRVHGNEAVAPIYMALSARLDGGEPFRLRILNPGSTQRPILRGTQIGGRDRETLVVQELYANGSITFEAVDFRSSQQQRKQLSPALFLGVAGCVALTAHRFRTAASAVDVEYGIEVELLHTVVEGIGLLDFEPGPFRDSIGQIQDRQTVFPRYSMGPLKEFDRLMTLLMRDLWDAAGCRFGSERSVHIDAFEALAAS